MNKFKLEVGPLHCSHLIGDVGDSLDLLCMHLGVRIHTASKGL